jgi:hypothetical protein
MTRQVTDQLYIELEYFTPEDYFVYTAEAQAACASTASMSVSAGVIKSTQVAMAVTSTAVATISHIEGADLFAFTNSTLVAQAQVIKSTNVALSSQVTFAATVNKIITFDSAEAATTTISVDYVRYRTVDAAVSAAFSLAAVAERSAGLSSALASTASQSISVQRSAGLTSSLASTASISVQASAAKQATATFASSANLTAVTYDINERPVQLYYNTAADPIWPLTTDFYSSSTKKYGTGSLYVSANTPYNQVFVGWPKSPYTGLLDIDSNQDFIIRFWIYWQGTNTAVSQNLMTTGTGLWSFNINNVSGSVNARFLTGSSQGNVTISTYTGNTGDSGWNLWEVKRSGSTITLSITDTGGTVRSSSGNYSGALACNSIIINPGGTGTEVYIDEFFFAKGTNTVTNWTGTANASEIADGGLDTTVFLYHFNGTILLVLRIFQLA